MAAVLLEVGHLVGHEGRFDGDDREVHGLGDLGDRCVRLQSLYLPAFGVDWIEVPFETCVDHVLEKHST